MISVGYVSAAALCSVDIVNQACVDVSSLLCESKKNNQVKFSGKLVHFSQPGLLILPPD